MSSAWAIIEDDSEILFLRRSFAVGRAGQWCPPGGTIWHNEWPEVACVREAFEETGLRVSIRRELATFDSAHYFLCTLLSKRCHLTLSPRECINSRWVTPETLLTLGTIMDLRRLIPVMRYAGLNLPALPNGFTVADPSYYSYLS